MKTILVTGGAGYIGSHIVLALLDQGLMPIVLDDLSTGSRQSVPKDVVFIEGDIADQSILNQLFHQYPIDAVIHCAASISVPESVSNPQKYYENNTVKSLTFLNACMKQGVKKFVFSSTAAVYGVPDKGFVLEDDLTQPINPYGHSKLMTEQMLSDLAMAYDANFIILRYFNVAGADLSMRTGQMNPKSIHLITMLSKAALGKLNQFQIFGTDYPTPDGTCIRDYIHISDLANAHVMALKYLAGHHNNHILNCGYGHGYSVKEVLAATESIIGEKLPTIACERRVGDPPQLIAKVDKMTALLGYVPEYNDLDVIIKSAIAWERQKQVLS